MKKYLIFGAGNLGYVLAAELAQSGEVIGFLDNDANKWGSVVNGIPVLGNTSVLNKIHFDEIVIASTMHFDEIKQSCLNAGVDESKFNREILTRLTVEIQARINYLQDFANLHGDEHKEACVAEGGVYQGMFSQEINKYFPDRTLYLFDTFEGFDRRDVAVEIDRGLSNVKEKYYSETSADLVLSRLPHKENVVIRKGYFPETVAGLENESFLFVNLDFDLYTPILAGLEFFYPRLIDGGVILVHDYFTKFYHGVEKAVAEFENRLGEKLIKTPIGDGISIALLKGKHLGHRASLPEAEKCRICGSLLSTPVIRYKNMLKDVTRLYKSVTPVEGQAEVPVYHCEKCGHYQIPYSEVEDNYYLMSVGNSNKLSRLQDDEIGKLKKLYPCGQSLLEVGCGDGTFLQRAKASFKTCVGMEPSKLYYVQCVDKNLNVRNEFLNKETRFEETFDFVVARQVFEHINDPDEVFSAMVSTCSENGVIMIEVPNGTQSIRENRYFDFFSDHVNYYTPESLLYLAHHNHIDVSCIQETFDGDYLLMLCVKRRKNDATLQNQINADFERVKSIMKSHKKVSIYGAGAKAQVVFLHLRQVLKDVHKIYDSDPIKSGMYLANAPVPIEIPDFSINDSDAIIILAKSYSDEIANSIKNLYGYDGEIYVI